MRRAALLVFLAAGTIASAQPNISAQSAIVIDAESGQTLWSRNPDQKMYPASTTKIMTALLVLEHCENLDELVRAPIDIEDVTGSSMHLRPFERVPVRDLLKAIMLRSANDGCVAAAHHVSGSVEAFAELMTQRARQMGCTVTTFKNPNGLHDEGHFTTARELATIAREAMKNETFREIVGLKSAVIKRSMNSEDRLMLNRNKFLDEDATAIGIKTGFTNDAGRCFVGSSERPGGEIITVVLNCQDWLQDQMALTEWTYHNFNRTTMIQKGAEITSAKVENGRKKEVALVAQTDYTAMLPTSSSGQAHLKELRVSALKAPVQEGAMVGLAIMEAPGIEDFEIPLQAAATVEPIPVIVKAATHPALWGGGLAAVIGGLTLKRRRRQMARRRRMRRR